MHDNVGNGPEPDRELNTDTGDLLDRQMAAGKLTRPDLSCLTEEERKALAESVHEISATINSPVTALFEMAMDKFVSHGAHVVGHGLQGMLWSAFHAMTLASGVMPHDTEEETFVGLHVEDSDDPHMVRACEMVADLLKYTMMGQHALGIDAWGRWIDEIGGNWDAYTTGVALAIKQTMTLAMSRMEPSPETADILGPAEPGMGYVRVVPRES